MLHTRSLLPGEPERIRVFASRHSALLTIAMSLPLLFSFQLKAPPDLLHGLPFALIWTWAIVSALTVPVLAGLEIVAWFVHFRHQNHDEVALPFHATALAVAIVAEVLFMSARRSRG
jgi:hypothetical protein